MIHRPQLPNQVGNCGLLFCYCDNCEPSVYLFNDWQAHTVHGQIYRRKIEHLQTSAGEQPLWHPQHQILLPKQDQELTKPFDTNKF